MARLIWSRRALDDAERLLAYIAQDAPVAATRFAHKLMAKVELLTTQPELGAHLPEDDANRYRELRQGNYRVIYRVEGDVVYLVAVHHAARLLDVRDIG